jgi:hypothetical protein
MGEDRTVEVTAHIHPEDIMHLLHHLTTCTGFQGEPRTEERLLLLMVAMNTFAVREMGVDEWRRFYLSATPGVIAATRSMIGMLDDADTDADKARKDKMI